MFHELFDGQNQLPYHIFLIDAETEHTHAHTELEICFILCGNAEFHINDRIFPLYEHDFIVVRPLALHQIQSCSDNCRILFLQIDLSAFQKYIAGLSDVSFQFSNVMNNRSHALYQRLYQSLRNILNTAVEGNSAWRLTALQEVITILSTLLSHYQASSDKQGINTFSHDEYNQRRMLSVLEYINQHWQQPLTLTSVAEAFSMNPSYFSRFFKNIMGTGFLNYLTRLRLKRSLNLLLDTNMHIIEIALECGFNDYKTYSRLFKKEFGETPQIYRKTHIHEEIEHDTLPVVQPTQVIEQLILSPDSTSSKKQLVPLKLDLNRKPCRQDQLHLNQTITVGSAVHLLRRKIQEHIVSTSKQLSVNYIRFTDLFSEHMQVYTENQTGHPRFNWEYLDDIFDFLEQNQLYPFIVLGCMPDALSTGKHTSDSPVSSGQTCVPRSMENFQALIREFFMHYAQKYHNRHFIEHWRIQLWSFPETPGNTWNGTEEQFFELAAQTYSTIRKYVPDISIGSPSTMGWQDFSMLKRFLEFCRREKIKPDFFCLNSYGFTSPLNKSYPAEFSIYENDFSYEDGDRILNKSADEMADVLSEGDFLQPIIVTEWGLNPYINDLSRDTSFMATWIIEHTIHLSSSIAELCYCLLTDYSLPDSSDYGCEFTGGQGILTIDGIPKPSFSAFQLLGSLGNKILTSGDDFLLTKDEHSWQLLIYNYTYFSSDYLQGRQELLFDEDRYNIYEKTMPKVFQIQMKIPSGKYRLETVQINRNHYAPYDEWIKMGKPKHICSHYLEYLMNKCCPKLQVETITTSNHLQIQRTVPVHGITLLKIYPM